MPVDLFGAFDIPITEKFGSMDIKTGREFSGQHFAQCSSKALC